MRNDVRKYRGTIFYTVDKDHPDIKFMEDWTENKEYSLSDIYTFRNDLYEFFDNEELKEYIKHDLMIVAGGGYNSRHIHNIVFRAERVWD